MFTQLERNRAPERERERKKKREGERERERERELSQLAKPQKVAIVDFQQNPHKSSQFKASFWSTLMHVHNNQVTVLLSKKSPSTQSQMKPECCVHCCRLLVTAHSDLFSKQTKLTITCIYAERVGENCTQYFTTSFWISKHFPITTTAVAVAAYTHMYPHHPQHLPSYKICLVTVPMHPNVSLITRGWLG